jgi:uncharacterized protein (DUF885 family)
MRALGGRLSFRSRARNFLTAIVEMSRGILPAVTLFRASLLGLWALSLCSVACRTAGPTPTAAAAPSAADGKTLAALAARYWDGRLAFDPLRATDIGDRRFDDRLPDLSPEARDRELARLRALRVLVEAVPESALGADEVVTRDLLLGEIDADLARGDCALEDWSVDARDGLQVAFLRLPELQPVRTVAEGRAMVARWQAMPTALDQQGANLRRGLAAGKVATADEVKRVLGQLDDLLAKPDAAWPLRTPAAAPHPDWPGDEQATFARAIDAAIAGGIRPAFGRFRDLLRGEILPLARDGTKAGISNVPGGAACYPRLIKVHTSLALTAPEIHKIGLEELDRIHAAMARVGQEAFGVSTLAALQKKLRAPGQYFQTRDEIEAAARAALARAQAAEPRFLGKLPRTPAQVKRIEPYEEKDAPIAYYRPAAIDGTRPGTYYVNTFEPETRPRYEVEVLAFHESVPGHHVQIAIAQELTGLPEFRKQSGVTAFVEGWGLYAEGLASELGLYAGPREQLGRLDFDAWRACRLVVDTGIHALGWSRAQAITFMEANALQEKKDIVNEVDRYIAWPGQALAYKLGEREIRRLRADAQQRLGPRFDLRAFHDHVLGAGAVSLTVLGKQIDRWVKSVP